MAALKADKRACSLCSVVAKHNAAFIAAKPEEFDQWMKGTLAEALDLAREYPPQQMRIVREGFHKEEQPGLEVLVSTR
jgi:hypothetical protein